MTTVSNYDLPHGVTILKRHMRHVSWLQDSKMAEASGGESSSFACATASDDKSVDVHSAESQKGKPICILCLGMAGSGKTTFVQVNFVTLVRSSNGSLHVYSESLITRSEINMPVMRWASTIVK